LECLSLDNGSYRTGPRDVSFLARAMPSLSFYVRLLALVLEASRMAKRGRFDNQELCRSTLAVFHALENVGVKFDISGMEHVRGLEGPCVFVANHMSTLETFILPLIIVPFKDVTFVIKKSLASDYPVYKHLARSRDPITVGRRNPREDLRAVLEGGTERLKAGRSIVVFPQATRSTTFNPRDFNTLGIKLAKRANVPVIPLAIRSDAWGNGKFIKDLGRIDPSKGVHFSFGKPIWVKGRGDEEHRDVLEFIRQRLKQWGL
jgi:1-acyl-sn-glycerol-3-phosphate acyltransferase